MPHMSPRHSDDAGPEFDTDRPNPDSNYRFHAGRQSRQSLRKPSTQNTPDPRPPPFPPSQSANTVNYFYGPVYNFHGPTEAHFTGQDRSNYEPPTIHMTLPPKRKDAGEGYSYVVDFLPQKRRVPNFNSTGVHPPQTTAPPPQNQPPPPPGMMFTSDEQNPEVHEFPTTMHGPEEENMSDSRQPPSPHDHSRSVPPPYKSPRPPIDPASRPSPSSRARMPPQTPGSQAHQRSDGPNLPGAHQGNRYDNPNNFRHDMPAGPHKMQGPRSVHFQQQPDQGVGGTHPDLPRPQESGESATKANVQDGCPPDTSNQAPKSGEGPRASNPDPALSAIPEESEAECQNAGIQTGNVGDNRRPAPSAVPESTSSPFVAQPGYLPGRPVPRLHTRLGANLRSPRRPRKGAFTSFTSAIPLPSPVPPGASPSTTQKKPPPAARTSPRNVPLPPSAQPSPRGSSAQSEKKPGASDAKRDTKAGQEQEPEVAAPDPTSSGSSAGLGESLKEGLRQPAPAPDGFSRRPQACGSPLMPGGISDPRLTRLKMCPSYP